MIRLIGYFFGIGTALALLVAAGVGVFVSNLARELPDYEVLAKYEPPVTTRVHASDGALMGEFARERRLYLPIQAVPDRVKAAFLSAEDKNFYRHPGVDVMGLFRAVINNLQTGSRQGASTITQQVAKNFLLTKDQTYERKIKEAILSFRIEQAYPKDRILELYLNEIYFGFVYPGQGAFGIAGAALTYFDKSVNELTVAEAAYLAALPKAPSNYHPYRHTQAAVERRNWVIEQMVENGYVSREEADKAKTEPLGVKPRRSGTYLFAGEYFTEEVRREIISRYGENALYEGGLSVRTTLDPNMQRVARKAMQNGLLKYDTLRGYRGPVKTIELGADWGVPLGEVKSLDDVPEWQLAVVLESSNAGLSIGLQPKREISGKLSEERETGTVSAEDMSFAMRHVVDGRRVKANSPADVLKAGDVVYVEKKQGNAYQLRQVPAVSGGLVAMDPHTGRVLAMVGGFSFSQSEFNRATQAMRQPGSSFKPIVYAAALDNGYTPASVIMDGPITITSGNTTWSPKNYDGKPGGPSTLRTGVERSRNLMTVRLAHDMGMKIVAEYAERFGVYEHLMPYLPMALGSGETTVMRMVSAYSVMANGGLQIKPSLIDRIQDRYGKTVYKHDERACEGCVSAEWTNQAEPELIDNSDQVLDPMTAYQITSMMEGVVLRGTATTLQELNRPIAGKTGTTNDEKDAWFIGFTPTLVVGLYVGFDQPQTLGKGTTGGGLAAPIFKEFMAEALKDTPVAEFQVPEGMNLIAINRKTGMRAQEGEPGTIMEAFKPGTGPADSYWVIGMDAGGEMGEALSPAAAGAIQGGGGGLY
ncbi:MAG TPA: penicillin-binding protein 1A [Rhizobiaceae bacterium]